MLKKKLFLEKIKEAVSSVMPIIIIVALLAFLAAPIATDVMLSFVVGSILLIIGLGLFMYGSDNSMVVIGNHLGSVLTRSRKLGLIITVSFIIGVLITMAEPDLQVLSGNVAHINSFVLVLTVSIGVGLFLVLCMLRILFGIQLRVLLWLFYAVVFVLAFAADPDYISVAFDSGGVTTGPMTAPFIIALGVGVAAIRSDKNAESDSFGLVALCSIGPILSVLILGFFYPSESSEIASDIARSYSDTVELGFAYIKSLPTYVKEVAVSLLPILIIFLVFQITAFHLNRELVERILVGMFFTYVGLVIFLMGVNVGFSSLGLILGQTLAAGWTKYLLIPIYAMIGWFVVSAEPAVHTLTKQVEEISAGAVTSNEMLRSLQVAISFAMALSMIRILGLDNTQKALIAGVISGGETHDFFSKAKRELMIDIPGNGVMMSVPLKSVGGGKTLSYITNERKPDKEVPKMEFKHELIVVVANSGYTDDVMDIARQAGAGGGTVIHAKGTGAKLANKFFGVSLAEEKEVMLIAETCTKKTAIMKSIAEKVGPTTSAGAICFSLPITEIAGIRMLED